MYHTHMESFSKEDAVMPRTKRVGLSRLANAWAEVSDSYEHAYLDKIRQFARATTPRAV